MTWFQRLMGFDEESHQQVQQLISLDGDTLVSSVNHRRVVAGRLEIPALAQLRDPSLLKACAGRFSASEVVADVQALHGDPQNENALFQVASQFNLLEMVGPEVSPERGVGPYEFDRTQGPACAVACGGGTIFRNYFVEIDGQRGQTRARQLDTLRAVGQQLSEGGEPLWSMQNGYALPDRAALETIRARLETRDDAALDALMAQLQVGIQWHSEVTLEGAPAVGRRVSQIYCSALPVAYAGFPAQAWVPFGPLVLKAAYEATFWAALRNMAETGCARLYLTLLGGGAFGNPPEWIESAVVAALSQFVATGLEVMIVSHGRPKALVRRCLEAARTR